MVEDELHLGAAVHSALRQRGVTVDWVKSVREGFDHAISGAYDCLMLDVKLPDGDGVELVRDLREADCQAPILMCTVMNETADRIRGLNTGADDYIGKPFDVDELYARIQALVRRSSVHPVTDKLEIGSAILWCHTRTLEAHHNRTVQLSSKEYLLLEHLFRNPGQVLTRDQLTARVWGPDTEVADSALDTYIYFLRKKCASIGLRTLIKTIRGEGYTLSAGR